MTLELNGIEVQCIIGERPEERDRPQRLEVDVKLEIGDAVADSDALTDTVDYALLAERIREALVMAQCRKIERAAKVAWEACRTLPGIRNATAKVTKAGAVPGLASASATYPGRDANCK